MELDNWLKAEKIVKAGHAGKNPRSAAAQMGQAAGTGA